MNDKLSECIEQYYADCISDRERGEIGKQLINFIHTNESFYICLDLLRRNDKKCVQMFCFNVFEIFTNIKWHKLPQQLKLSIRNEIQQMVFSGSFNENYKVSSRLCKILVYIGRNDFRTTFTDFFDFIEQILSDKSKLNTGIHLIDYLLDEDFGGQYMLTINRDILMETCKQKLKKWSETLIIQLNNIYQEMLQTQSSPHSPFGQSLSPGYQNSESGSSQIFSYQQTSSSSLNVLSGSGYHSPSYISTTGYDSVNLSNIVFDVILKLIKLDPINLVYNDQFIITLIELAAVPLKDFILCSENINVVAQSVYSLVKLISNESLIVNVPMIVGKVYVWANYFLQKYQYIHRSYSEYISGCASFFDIFMTLFVRRYLFGEPYRLDFLSNYLSFVNSLTCPEDAHICLETISHLYSDITYIVETFKVHQETRATVDKIFSEFILTFIIRLLTYKSNQGKIFIDVTKENFERLTEDAEAIIKILPDIIINKIIEYFLFEYKNLESLCISLNEKISSNSSVLRVVLSNDDERKFLDKTNDFLTASRFLISAYKKSTDNTIISVTGTLLPLYTNVFGLMNFIYNNLICKPGFDKHIKDLLFKSLKYMYRILVHILEILAILELLDDHSLMRMQINREELNSNTINIIRNIFNESIVLVQAKIEIDTLASMTIAFIFDKFSFDILQKSIDINQYISQFKCRSLLNRSIKQSTYISESGISLLFNPIFMNLFAQKYNGVSGAVNELFCGYFQAFYDLSSLITTSFKENKNEKYQIYLKSYIKECKIMGNIIIKLQDKNPNTKKAIADAFFNVFKQLLMNFLQFLSNFDFLKPTIDLVQIFIITYRNLFSQAFCLMLQSYSSFISNLSGLNQHEFNISLPVVSLIIKSCSFFNMEINAIKPFIEITNFVINQLVPICKKINHNNVNHHFVKLIKIMLTQNFIYFTSQNYPDMREGFSILLNFFIEDVKLENIETYRSFLREFININERRNLYKNQIFQSNALLPKLILNYFTLLIDNAYQSLHDELLDNLYCIADNNFDAFYGEILPYLIRNIPLPIENTEYVLENIDKAKDHPTFRIKMANVASDIRFFNIINREDYDIISHR